MYIRRYTSLNENFEYGHSQSNALLQFCLKLKCGKQQKDACQLTKCYVINDFKLFPTVYHRIYCHKFLTLSNQTSCYKSKCDCMVHLLFFRWSTAPSTVNAYYSSLLNNISKFALFSYFYLHCALDHNDQFSLRYNTPQIVKSYACADPKHSVWVVLKTFLAINVFHRRLYKPLSRRNWTQILTILHGN